MNSADTLEIVELPPVTWLMNYRLRRSLRKSPVFVRTCRLLMQTGETVTLFRLAYVAKSSNYSAAEQNAEEFLASRIRDGLFGSGAPVDVQWKRGRMVTHQTLDAEDDNILKTLYRLCTSGQQELLVSTSTRPIWDEGTPSATKQPSS